MLRVTWSTWELIAVSFPSNSRPGIASLVTLTGETFLQCGKLLLRQREVDEDWIERLERNDLSDQPAPFDRG